MFANTTLFGSLYSNGAMTVLGTLGGSNSAANGINNNGQVVGNSFAVVGNSPFQTQDAFLYSNGKMIDLNSLIDANSGWTLVDATAINDKGQIVGLGLNAQGLEKSFLLTPNAIPIPSAIWLFGSALVGFGLFGRDKAA